MPGDGGRGQTLRYRWDDMNSNEAHTKKEVTEAGFRPTPFPFLVWNIRRPIWPFIRQYHFFQVEKLAEIQADFDETLAQ
jgi:hypothetical protein